MSYSWFGLLEAGSTNNSRIYIFLHVIKLTTVHLDRLQGSRNKTWTRKSPIADLMTTKQDLGINNNSRFYWALTKAGPDRIGSDRIGLTKPGPDRTGLTKPGWDCVRLTKPGLDPKKKADGHKFPPK